MNYQDFYKTTNAGNRIIDKFGTASHYPSYEELQRIITEITSLQPEQRTETAWRDTIKRYVQYTADKSLTGSDLTEVQESLAEILSIIKR